MTSTYCNDDPNDHVLQTPPPESPSPTWKSWFAFNGTPPRVLESMALVFLTFIADWCLYHHVGSAGLGVLVLISGIVLHGLRARSNGIRSVVLSSMLALLVVTLLWSPWWLPVILSIATLLLLSITLWEPDWSLLESGWNAVIAPFQAIPRLFAHAGNTTKLAPGTCRIPRIPVRVILVPLMVTALFLLVFMSANPVIDMIFSLITSVLQSSIISIPDYLNLFRLSFWIIFLLAFAVLIRPLCRSALVATSLSIPVVRGAVDSTQRDNLNYLTALTTLISLNLLFFIYNAIDAIYLYFKATLPAGMNWSEYTHAGCGWLTFALFLSSIVLGTIFWNRLNFHPRGGFLKKLGYIWIAQNAVLGVGALRRLHLYIDYSGLTHLIITGLYGSLLVMVGLVIMARKIQRNYSAIWLLRRYVTAFYLGLCVLAITPYGYVCAAYNVPRALEDKPRALWPILLKDLPPDALPHAIKLIDYQRSDGDPSKTSAVQKGIAAIMLDYADQIKLNQERPWQGRALSAAWALKHIEPYEGDLRSQIRYPREAEAARTRLLNDYDLLSGSRDDYEQQ